MPPATKRSSPPLTRPQANVERAADGDLPLSIAFLTYRGKPHVGGQGVYTRHLTKALVDLGHHVEVLGGQPVPDARRAGAAASSCPSLDIYNDYFPMRMPGIWELKTLRRLGRGHLRSRPAPSPSRWPSACGPSQHLRSRVNDFDLVQDNQCLGYGLLGHGAHGPAGARHDPPPDHRRPPPRDGARRDRVAARSRRPAGTRSRRCRPGSRRA